VLSRFAQYAERSVYLTDALTGVNLAPDLYLSERARAIAPVRMTGNYGGEMLRGVIAFKPVDPLAGLFAPELESFLRMSKDTYKQALGGRVLSFAAFRQAPWLHFGVAALEQTQLTLRTPYLDNDLVRTAFRAPASVVKSDNVCLRLIQEGNPALSLLSTDRGVVGSGASPILSAARRQWLEFLFKAEYAYDYGMPQWLARADRHLRPLRLERAFLGRHKSYHFRMWYRDALTDYVRDVLLSSESLLRPYIVRRTTEQIVARRCGELPTTRSSCTNS
jgi:asparagine synthase (glutamine-hydrolysing)